MNLKEEWLEKIKIVKNQNISKGYGYFSVNTQLYCAPEEIRLDKEITMIALLSSHEFLWNIHENFLTDKAFILDLIHSDYKQNIFKGLKNALKADEDIYRACLNRGDDINDSFLIPQSIIENKELMLETLPKINLFKRKTLKEFYKFDKEIIKTVITYYPNEFCNLQKRMQNFIAKDKKLMLSCAQYIQNYKLFNAHYSVDMDVVDIVLNESKSYIHCLPDSLKNNKDFILYAIEKFNISSNYLSDNIKKDKDIAILCVSKDGSQLEYFNDFYRNDKEMILLAFKTTQSLRDFKMSRSLLNDKELMQMFLDKKSSNYQFIGYDLKSDFDFSFQAVKLNPKNYEYLPSCFQSNYEFLYLAFKDHDSSFHRIVDKAPNDIRNDIIQSGLDLHNNKDIQTYILKKSLEAKLERINQSKIMDNITNKKLKI